jgi:hypothetical protein
VDGKREMLRHALATVAYRAGKTLRDPAPGFADFRAGPSSRSAVEILAHVGDLFDWALEMARGQEVWRDSVPLAWEREVERFHATLARLDGYLASEEPLGSPAEQLFQGPIADALTHVGQIGMLRRLAGAPVRGENYAKARIAIGRIGPDQAPPKREFD